MATKIDFATPATALANERQQAQQNNTYVADTFDKKVLKTLADLVKQSLATTDQYHAKITNHHAAAKKAMDEMEALLEAKGKKLGDKDVDVLATSAKLMKTIAAQLSSASADVYGALSDFRGNWQNDYRPLVSKPVLVDTLLAGRTRSMEEGKKVDAGGDQEAEVTVLLQPPVLARTLSFIA